jgi:hypothetical protein
MLEPPKMPSPLLPPHAVRSTAVSPIVKQIFFILGAKVRRIFVNSKYSSSNASRFAEEISRFAEIVSIVVKLFLSLHRQTNDFGQETKT